MADSLSCPSDTEEPALYGSVPDGRDYMTLFEAVLWVGTKGQPMTSEEIDRRGLDEAGEVELLKALATGTVTATGWDKTKLRADTGPRIPIPASCWESASSFEQGKDYRVAFADERQAGDGGMGGKLYVQGAADPTWADIQIKIEDLLKRFRHKREVVPDRTAPPHTVKKAAHRIGPKENIARTAINNAFPDGPPAIDLMDNQTFLSHIAIPKGQTVSDIVILRAAGRAKKPQRGQL